MSAAELAPAAIPPAARPPSIGRAFARAQGLLALAALAGLGAAFWAVSDTAAELPSVEVWGDDGGATARVVRERPGARLSPRLLILSRVPIAFDPRRSILTFEEGGERIVPRNARTVLIHSDRRLEAWRGPALSPAWFELLEKSPPASRLQQLRDRLRGPPARDGILWSDDRLRRFWD